jgi:hypothetical protein
MWKDGTRVQVCNAWFKFYCFLFIFLTILAQTLAQIRLMWNSANQNSVNNELHSYVKDVIIIILWTCLYLK